MIIFFSPAPPPFHISPRAATFASFPMYAFKPVSSSISFFTSLYFHPRFALPFTIPSAVTGAGTPTPIPRMSSSDSFLSSIFVFNENAISGKIASPSANVFVGISHFSTIVPVSSNNPILTVVPPMSTPKQ